MANSKAISTRIPDELLEKIDRLAEEKYKSHKGTPNRSLVILDAIVAYFDTLSDIKIIPAVSDSVSIIKFNGLRDIVSALSDSVKQLESKMIALSDSNNSFINEDVNSKENEPKQNQLSIIPVSDNVVDDGLTIIQLAERINSTPEQILKQKGRYFDAPSKFTNWARKKDPDGYGWEFREGSPLYYRVEPLA
jgi:metal-responsive CopG/Arc/MetJ family transcriptional regulator